MFYRDGAGRSLTGAWIETFFASAPLESQSKSLPYGGVD